LLEHGADLLRDFARQRATAHTALDAVALVV
jgi:hypothetical protein